MGSERSFNPAALIKTNPEETLVAWRNALPVSINGRPQLLAVNDVRHTQLSDVYILQGPDGSTYAAKTPKNILPESLLKGPNVQARRDQFMAEAVTQPDTQAYLTRRTSREFMAEVSLGNFIDWDTELANILGKDPAYPSTIERLQAIQNLRQASQRIEIDTLKRLQTNSAFPKFYQLVTNQAEYENPNSPWYHKALTLMEYIPGPTLDKWIEGNQPISERLRVMQTILTAIGGLHQQGIYHADLKPWNIIIDQNTGDPRIIDFSSSTSIPDDFSYHGIFNAIDPDSVFGTRKYTDPRLIITRQLIVPDALSDLYSLGKILSNFYSEVPACQEIARKAMHYEYKSARQMQQELAAIAI